MLGRVGVEAVRAQVVVGDRRVGRDRADAAASLGEQCADGRVQLLELALDVVPVGLVEVDDRRRRLEIVREGRVQGPLPLGEPGGEPREGAARVDRLGRVDPERRRHRGVPGPVTSSTSRVHVPSS